jgi:hypothetical protein
MADADVTPYNGTVPTGGDSLDNLNIYYNVSRAARPRPALGLHG